MASTSRKTNGWKWLMLLSMCTVLQLGLLFTSEGRSPEWQDHASLPDSTGWAAPDSALRLPNPVAASLREESARQGRKLYRNRCARCHGETAKGDGSGAVGARELGQPVTDLTSAAFRSQPDGAIFWKITAGRGFMPGYAAKLSAEKRWHLVNYLRTLAPKK
ncbi:MAG: cytochrome c [Bacteroidota bacterium]